MKLFPPPRLSTLSPEKMSTRLRFLANWGPVYWNAALYRGVAALSSKERRIQMYRTVAREIGNRSTLDLCCGTGGLSNFLKSADYIGMDKNPAFIRYLARNPFPVIQGAVLETPWPKSDCIVIINSLSYFLRDFEPLWRKLQGSDARRIIISEPVRDAPQ